MVLRHNSALPKGLRIHFFYIPSLKTKDYIYIVEVKIDNTADAALQQIEEKAMRSHLRMTQENSS